MGGAYSSGAGEPLTGLGAYSVGAYNLEPPDLELKTHSLDWGPQSGAYSPGPPVLGHRFWSWRTTHWTGCLQSGGLRSGGQQTWATGFGAGKPLTGLGPYNLGAYSLEAYSLGRTHFGAGGTLTGLGAYSLGAHSLGPPVLELENHSLD